MVCMKRTIGLFGLLMLSAGLAGCLHQSAFEQSVVSRVHLGMAKQDAVSELGELKLDCRQIGSTDSSNAWTVCTREKPLLLEGCIQRVNIKVSEQDKISDIEIPEPVCAGL